MQIQLQYNNVYYQENPEYFNELLNLVQTCKNSYFSLLKKNDKYKHLHTWIDDSLPLLNDECFKLKTKCFWILNGLTSFPVCWHCHRNDRYLRANVISISEGYHKYCSSKCANNDDQVIEKAEQSKLLKYGDAHYTNAKKISDAWHSHSQQQKQEIQSKLQHTKQKRHGDKFFTNREKAHQTYVKNLEDDPEFQQKINQKISNTKRICASENPSYVQAAVDKMIQTNLQTKGVMFNGQYEPTKQKIHKTIELNSSVDPLYWKNKTEKIKNTKLLHFNDENFVNPEKSAATYFAKTGYKHPSQNPSVRAKYDFHLINQKIYETKKKHGTFNTSDAEEHAFQMLKFILPDIVRQFKSNAYPFCADFYSPSYPNIRFEFQGSWTHGQHAFDKTNSNDLKQLEKWINKSLNSKFYLNAIQTWTVRDPLKRKIAKQNKLCLIEFWTLDDVLDYVLNFFDNDGN